MSELVYSGVLYVTCKGNKCKDVLKEAENSGLNVKSYRNEEQSGADVIVNLRGSNSQIKDFSKKLSKKTGVLSVRCVITK